MRLRERIDSYLCIGEGYCFNQVMGMDDKYSSDEKFNSLFSSVWEDIWRFKNGSFTYIINFIRFAIRAKLQGYQVLGYKYKGVPPGDWPPFGSSTD